MRKTSMSRGCTRTMWVIFLVLLTIGAGQAAAQQSLEDVVTEMGFGWMAGRWKATTDEGQELLLVYRWVADKNAIVMDFKMGEEASSHGMIYYLPDEEKVAQISVDSQGNVSRATWDVIGEKAVSTSERTDNYGQKRSMAIAHSKVKAGLMKVELFSVENGQIGDEPQYTVEFKRQKRQAAKPKPKAERPRN